jgi:hypothetical protein
MNGKSLLVGLTLVVGTFCSVAPSIAASQKPYQVAETQTELYIRVQKEMADEARANTTKADKTPVQVDATNSDQRPQDVTGTVGMAPTRKSDLRANPDASR